ncbi:hypothetical protein V1525DRAFT_426734 [Lipomyces kononenkoae]|uniref:Uncharacterized protein n=1 Tax=Lipomyces kononenkoae TaxID=34357 RepID=A0ACC3SZU3_LIPKO
MEREREELMNFVRRPLSPDAQVEVPVSWEAYEEVKDILESDNEKYPRLWYDSARSMAIVVAPLSDLHGSMASELASRIRDEVTRICGLHADMTACLSTRSDIESSRPTRHGLTTRAWDTEFVYTEGDRRTIIMIAIEVGVSQSYTTAVTELEDELRNQRAQFPYRPLVINGVTWFGQVRNFVLETYRAPGDDVPRETILEPTNSFVNSVTPNLQEVVLRDCIPDHIIRIHGIEAIPVNFFHREWFEREFGNGMIENAVNRIWRNIRIGQTD